MVLINSKRRIRNMIKSNLSLIMATFFAIQLCISCRTAKDDKVNAITDFSALIQPVPKSSIFAEDGYYVWGASVIKGDDGLYHMFYSRWKEEYGFNAWVTHSEIAHATSEKPGGCFIFRFNALILSDRFLIYRSTWCKHPAACQYLSMTMLKSVNS